MRQIEASRRDELSLARKPGSGQDRGEPPAGDALGRGVRTVGEGAGREHRGGTNSMSAKVKALSHETSH